MKPVEHQVRERAYDIWEGGGRVFGRADEHWLRAEAELVATIAAEQAATSAQLLTVQPSAPAMSDAPSPAKALKPRSARAAGAGRAVSNKAEEAARAVGKAEPKVAPAKAAGSKASAAKASVSKTSAAKPAAGKAKSAPRGNGASSIALH